MFFYLMFCILGDVMLLIYISAVVLIYLFQLANYYLTESV